MKIGIVGLGHVGRQLFDRLSGSASIVTFDPRQDREYPTRELELCDLAFMRRYTDVGLGRLRCLQSTRGRISLAVRPSLDQVHYCARYGALAS